jgi:hypothetical protein
MSKCLAQSDKISEAGGTRQHGLRLSHLQLGTFDPRTGFGETYSRLDLITATRRHIREQLKAKENFYVGKYRRIVRQGRWHFCSRYLDWMTPRLSELLRYLPASLRRMRPGVY